MTAHTPQQIADLARVALAESHHPECCGGANCRRCAAEEALREACSPATSDAAPDSRRLCLFCGQPALPGSEALEICREHAELLVKSVNEHDGPAKGWRSERARCRVCGHRQISCFPVTANADALECGNCHNMTAEVES